MLENVALLCRSELRRAFVAVPVEPDFSAAGENGGEFGRERFRAVHGDKPGYLVLDTQFGEELEESRDTNLGGEQAGAEVCEVVVGMLAGACGGVSLEGRV